MAIVHAVDEARAEALAQPLTTVSWYRSTDPATMYTIGKIPVATP